MWQTKAEVGQMRWVGGTTAAVRGDRHITSKVETTDTCTVLSRQVSLQADDSGWSDCHLQFNQTPPIYTWKTLFCDLTSVLKQNQISRVQSCIAYTQTRLPPCLDSISWCRVAVLQPPHHNYCLHATAKGEHRLRLQNIVAQHIDRCVAVKLPAAA